MPISVLRRKILIFTMSSVMLVVFCISGAINIANFIKLRQRADTMLTIISDYNGTLPINPTEIEDKVQFTVNDETPFQTRYFVIRLDKNGNLTEAMTSNIASVEQDDIEKLSKITAEFPDKSRGSIDTFRYLARDTESGKMITFLDRSQDMESQMQLMAISFFTAVIGLIIIFIILVFISNKLLAPFVRNHEKQKQFITDAGHELKTPLAIIRTNSEVLEMCYGKNEWLDSIQNQTTRLDGLVKGLLQLSKTNEFVGDSEHVQFSLSGTVNDIAESFRTMAEQKGHKMHFDVIPQINYKGNSQSISTLVSILVDNAIKYASEGGEIFVSLSRMGKGSGKTARLVIENDTDMDSSEDPNRFFERFYRSERSRSRQTGGYGIGLSVAKNITDNHKGKISVAYNGNRIAFTVIL